MLPGIVHYAAPKSYYTNTKLLRGRSHTAMSLQLSTADIEPEDVTEAELQGIAELRARILKAQGRDVPLPEQV